MTRNARNYRPGLLALALLIATLALAMTAAPPRAAGGIDFEQGRTFWSFQPVQDRPAPAVRDAAWPANDVDRFVLAKLEEKGLTPPPAADKRTLIRRATFDLTGLPATPEEVQAFVQDTSPDAFEKVVERLLASPAYGERWGRHWLDLVRYADTSGCNSDFPIPTAYKYRDYVINSFNGDKPYDQFVREQIAGDLMPGDTQAQTEERLVATGYLAISRRFGSRNNENHLTIEDLIDNLGKTVLGLSVSCARCHDHKYDPVSQSDYYALYGIFSSTKLTFPGTEIYPHPKDYIPIGTPEAVAAYNQRAADLAALDDTIEGFVVERGRVQAAVAAGNPPPNGRTLEQVKADILDARGKLKELENKPFEYEVTRVYGAGEGTPADAKIHRKGNPGDQGDVVPRGFLTVLGGDKVSSMVASRGSGRSELAQWLTRPTNSLTARVMVNRIWQHHFGKGLVATPSDFGSRGKPPTHPELLDWLASRFVEGGWSVKQMHRLIMSSRAYQAAVREDGTASAVDPDNHLLWTFEPRRLSAEEVRDAMLSVSGALDRTPPAGGHPFPPETEWKYTQHRPFVAVYDTNRRSVYLMQQRIKKHPFLAAFDGADPNATTPDRSVSTTPLQALFMLNDPFAHETADKLAVRVGLALTGDEQRIDYLHQLAYGRPATPEEVQLGAEYLRQCAAQLAATGVPWDQQSRGALASYARVILSSSEFLYVD